MSGKPANRLSHWHMLTRTYLYINKRLRKEIMQKLGPMMSGDVLDIGAGYAQYRPLFTRAASYVALDLDIERAPDGIADVSALPIRSAAVDGVVCTEVLEHVIDPDTVVTEVHRVLRDDGRLLVTVPMSWNLHYEPYDFRRYTCYGLWQLLEKHGFVISETHRVGGLFALVGSRLVDGIATELYRRWTFLPHRLRHAVILCYSIPMSLLFYFLSRVADGFQRSDVMTWAVLATKRP
ncbi:MAG: class I SAM-dependent methyltransferase [Actinomycetota bacterium]